MVRVARVRCARVLALVPYRSPLWVCDAVVGVRGLRLVCFRLPGSKAEAASALYDCTLFSSTSIEMYTIQQFGSAGSWVDGRRLVYER